MTTFEASMWIMGSLFFVALLFGGMGAFFEERGQKEAQNASILVAVALFGMGCLAALKAIIGLLIN